MHQDGKTSDDEAIGMVLAGDREAFRIIVDRYQGRLVGFCTSRTGSEEEARDAAQEIFIRAFSSVRTYRRGESFATWLFAIAANRLKTRSRRQAVELGRVEAAGKEEAAKPFSPGPEEAVLRSIEAESLRSIVAKLPDELRRPIELYYFAELGVDECGSILGLGREAVKSRLFRARKRLRAGLEALQPEETEGGIHR
jgi:RNA polymerase sigma-70 factor (ECF subfamily)